MAIKTIENNDNGANASGPVAVRLEKRYSDSDCFETLRNLARGDGECVPGFSTVSELHEADTNKREHKPTYVYPRDGTYDLVRLESGIGKLIGLAQDKIVAYSSGMQALTAVVEAASPTKGTVILHSQDEYARTRKFLKGLAKRGAQSIEVDTTSMDNLREKIVKHRPEIIVLETIANGPNMPVIDIDALFSIKALREISPLIILDNTLPTPTLIPPRVLIEREGFRVAVVESGMKAYSRNTESFGILYSSDQKLLWDLREDRITRGGMSSVFQQKALNLAMPDSKGDFDSRNRTIMRNSLELAKGCYEAQEDGDVFTVWHPNLENHPNSVYANIHFPDGAAPLFYIQASDPFKMSKRGKTQDEIAEALNRIPSIKENCVLGHSFGLNQTRILPDLEGPFVRISAGIEDDEKIKNLRTSFKEALRSMH